ncbi:ribose ABC transporter permease [Microbacterium faecale]|uniref:Ribose ABC transporter permease n=1 Tax=Microbacterium faecale TaxID=1804630 RepID=A0A916Y3X9_9MICO|nr:ABC transporter permease [Microbacterium faecale]GGD30026.1 ribose ABC transporter permease [Microbacterium faecale]
MTITPTTAGPRVTAERGSGRAIGWIGMPAGIVVLIIVGSLLNDKFLSVSNLTNVLINMSIVGVIVVGMTFVFITRGMADLSVPATVAVGGILVLALQPVMGSIAAGIVGVLVATAAGLLNGFLIGYAGLNPVITTLATGTIVLGIAQAAVGGVIVYGDDKGIQEFLTGRIFGTIPVIVLIFAAIAVIGHLVLSRSVWGRWTYAVGSNPDATRASAVPVRLTRSAAFILTGSLAGFAGVLLGLTLQTARPGIGIGYEFDAITAVVVGGVSLLGGFGSIPRAIGGLLFVQLLTNILVLQGVPTEPQGLIKGGLIAGAVALDVALRRRGGRR